MKNLIPILAIFALMGMAAANNGGDPTIFHKHSAIPVTAAGWGTDTVTSDCQLGWGDDSWVLTLTEAKDVTIEVDDCCCVGDYFEIYVDGVKVGTTPAPAAWGCGQPGPISTGSATVSLMPGTYTITVRDAGFDGRDLEGTGMCPAGFTVSGETDPYTGTTVPETAVLVGAIALLTPGMIYLVRRKR